MARENKQHEDEDTPEIEKTVDPYTGELVPVAEDADQFVEVVPEETDDRRGSKYILNEETSMDSYAADADAIAEQAAHFTDDEDIKEEFAERQKLASGGREALLEELDEHNSLSPRLTGGDIDASWQYANQAGDEAVGGSIATPDQDVVDELGEGAGLTYKDDEPLDYDAKVLDRDRKRWELDPASALTNDDELENELDDEEGDDEEDAEDELEDEEIDELEDDDELEEDDELEDDDELDDEELDELLELDEDDEEEETDADG